nr:hypothetical protein [Clostridia bacterium]
MYKKLLRSTTLHYTLTLILLMVFSTTVLSPYFSNPQTHSDSLAVIKECKEQATAISLTVTLASTAITMLSDDVGTPIANELSEFSTPLMIIVCILYFEQYLLTAMETLAFSILIPVACLFFILSLHLRRSSLQVIGYKFLLIALLCAVAIPASAHLTILIRETFAESINTVYAQIDEIGAHFSEMLNASDFWKSITSFASGIGEILEFFKSALGLLIDAVAILLLTSCIVPVITVVLFIWCIKSIICGHMENLEDTAVNVINRLPRKKKNLPPPESPNDSARLTA